MAAQRFLCTRDGSRGTRWMPCLLLVAVVLGGGCAAGERDSAEDHWISLFNGKDLTGWTPKITGYELGENFGNTFRVEDGLLTVAYDQYEKFDNRFGHLFYKTPFSHYRLRVECRFIGEQTPGGPGWAFRNSGMMIHCQPPETMRKDQSFPVCIEVQLLGGNGKNERSTGNLCTPGTHVEMKGEVVTEHCPLTSKVGTPRGEWTRFEVEVRGGEVIRHLVNGEVVTEYSRPHLDPEDADGKRLLEGGAPADVTEGYVSLQAETHPVQFRNIELLILE